MKVLITGGAGYIGSILVGDLLDREDVELVTVVDNLMYRQVSLSHFMSDPRFEFILGDVRDADLMNGLVSEYDVIIPLACIVGMPACSKNTREAIEVNYQAVTDICDLSDDSQKIIFPTTNSGYGIGLVDSGELVECTEDTPLNPISLYGETKVDAENYLLDLGSAVTLRLATVFGASPRMRVDLLVNDFTYKAFSDGYLVLFESHFKRNFVHVRDVSKAFLFAIDNFDKMRGEPFNVGLSEANLSKRELCDAIKVHLPSLKITESDIGEDPDKRNYIVSNAKIENLGWRPDHSLDAGIEELVKFYKMLRCSDVLFTNL